MILDYEKFNYNSELTRFINNRELKKEDIQNIVQQGTGIVLFYWRKE